jgi:hypothetical protein
VDGVLFLKTGEGLFILKREVRDATLLFKGYGVLFLKREVRASSS